MKIKENFEYMLGYEFTERLNRHKYPFKSLFGDSGKDLRIPDFEDIVKEIGEKFYKVERYSLDLFEAYSRGGSITYRADGSTPTEAVANLWMLLNPIKDD